MTKPARKRTVAYWVEHAVLDFTIGITKCLREREISQKQFAEMTGKKPAYISRVMGGADNVTIKTMVEMAHALDLKLDLRLVPQDMADVLYPQNPQSNVVRLDPTLRVFRGHGVPEERKVRTVEQRVQFRTLEPELLEG